MTYLKKNKKKLLSIFVLLLITFFIFYLLNKPEKVNLSIGDCHFIAEVVRSPRDQFKGLSGRKHLNEEEGMLFVFPDKKDRVFVMRNMNFPLDIIFISDNKVVNLYHDLEPEGAQVKNSYHSGQAVDLVLEINAGLSRACKIAVGSEINW